MRERPILFSAPMVRAILEGRKTQTRRIVKPQPRHIQALRDGTFETSSDGGFDRDVRSIACPYGVAGDRLWVRETWCPGRGLAFVASREVLMAPAGAALAPGIIYAADGATLPPGTRWRPSIHMPRSASRLTLEVVAVRVERLSAITEEDARAEGVACFVKSGRCPPSYSFVGDGFEERDSAARAFLHAFRAMHELAPDADPWVWVVEFRRAEAGRG